jgi:hypothetical protein
MKKTGRVAAHVRTTLTIGRAGLVAWSMKTTTCRVAAATGRMKRTMTETMTGTMIAAAKARLTRVGSGPTAACSSS